MEEGSEKKIFRDDDIFNAVTHSPQRFISIYISSKMEQLKLVSDIFKDTGEIFAKANELSGIFSILSAAISLFILIETLNSKNRNKKKIKIILSNGGRQLKLPGDLLRQELNRTEVLGRIGMLPMKEKGKRFSIKHLSQPEFFESLGEAISGNQDSTLFIPCSNEEFDQFHTQLDGVHPT